RRDSPPRRAEGREQYEKQNKQRESRHHCPVVEAVRHGIRRRQITPLRRGHAPRVDKRWTSSDGCKREHHRLRLRRPHEERLTRRMQREQYGRNDGDSRCEHEITPTLTR